MFTLPDVRFIVASALAEDVGLDPELLLAQSYESAEVLGRDVTTAALADEDARFVGRFVARQDCVVAGLPVADAVFEALSRAAGLFDPVECFPLVAEGTRVSAGTPVAEVDGPAGVVLAGERTALDFVMILSGIATETARWVEAAGPGLAVCDTRKTVPGLRELSKYAVSVGGGTNHRHGLWDMVLVKDNHRRYAGSISHAVMKARAAHPALAIEVEADTLDQALEAVRSGVEMVLLDNFDDTRLADAVAACREAAVHAGREVLTEASGSIRYERLTALRASGVDRVSTSALTMAPPIDFGLDEV